MGSKDNASGSGNTKRHGEPSGAVKALATFTPRCIYFYYLKPIDNHHADVLAFLYTSTQTLSDNQVDNILVRDFVSQASSGTYTTLIPIGHFFEDVTWVRQSYLVIMVKSPFILEDIDIWDSNETLKSKKMLTVTGAHGVRYHNDITRKDSKTWNKDKQEKEKLVVKLKFKSTLLTGDVQTATHDDSGTNLGPPLPP